MNWRPVDIVVAILAFTIGLALLITVTAPLFLGVPITDARSRFLATIANAVIAVISVYVGSRIRGSRKDDE